MLPDAGYYGPFMEELFARFDGQALVSTVASLGFCPSPPGPSPQPGSEQPFAEADLWTPSHTSTRSMFATTPTFTLQQQIEHKAAFLKQFCSAASDPPVVIVGHSIGYYIGCRAVRMLEALVATGGATSGAAVAGAQASGAAAETSPRCSLLLRLP